MPIRSAQRFRIRSDKLITRKEAASILGIPIIAPGEVFTDAIVEKIVAYKAAGLLVQGPADPDADVILTCQTPGLVHKGC